MVNSNTSNSVSEQGEQQKPKKDTNLSYFKQLSREYAKKTLSWDVKWNQVKDLNLYKKYKESNYVNKDFISDFKESLSDDNKKLFHDENYEDDTQKSKDLYEEFKKELDITSVIYERQKNQLNDLIDKKYSLNKVWKSNIQDEINKLDSTDLEKYIFSLEELDKFVKKISKTAKQNINNINHVRKIFEEFSYKSSWEFAKVINENVLNNPNIWSWEEVLTSLTIILNKIKLGDPLDTIDIKDLFSYWVFNPEQKKQFLKTFLPIISLQELIDPPLNIINEEEAKERKNKEITETIKKKRIDVNVEPVNEKIEIKNASDGIKLKDIFISTEEFIDSHIVVLEKSESFAKKLVESFNNTTLEMKEIHLKKMQTLEVFKKKVIEDRRFNKLEWWKQDLEKLKNWVIFRFKADKEETSNFYEITNFNDNWKFIWKNRSLGWKYNSSWDIKEEELSYERLYELMASVKIKEIEIITPEELISKVQGWDISEIKDEIGEAWKLEIDKYIKEIDFKIEKLKEWKNSEEYESNEEYKKLIKQKETLLSEDALNNISVKEDLNQFMLLSKIDETDPEWKEFWLKEWVSFKISEWDDQEYKVFTITNINQLSKTIEIKNAFWETESPITFDQFYKGFSVKNSIKTWTVTRFSNNAVFDSIINNVIKDPKLASDWWQFEIKDGKIMKVKQENVIYPFLVQSLKDKWKCNKLLKIHDTIWVWASQMIWVSLWEIKNWDKEWGKDEYEVWDKQYVTVWFLENYIKNFELKPKTLEKEKDDWDNIKESTIPPRWWFFKWFLSNKSVSEIMWWLKMWFDEFKNHLKWWNDEHAAKVALATWWRFLPIEVRTELKARVETAEKKHMDEAVSRLGSVDTPDAIRLVYKRLNFSNTEEYKKEAAMVFMLQKYWNLYNKNYPDHSPLNSRKWEFLWFKALSWYRGDVTKHPLYIEIKQKCETPDDNWRTRNFTEEELVWNLMKRQCREEWYYWVHRRSRLHKEVEKLKKDWIQAELADWEKKWKETRNPKDQLEKWIDEIKAWSPANAVWRWKKLVDRWDGMTKLNEIPFILINSWIINSLPDDLTNSIKDIVEEWRLVFLARFMSYPKDTKLAMETLRVLSHKIQNKKWNIYPDIWVGWQKLYDNITSTTLSEQDRIKACIEFYNKKWTNWKTYWDALTRAMYMSADWETWEDGELNSILLVEKEKPWADNNILKDYYNTQKAYLGTAKVLEDYMSDSFAQSWVSAIWPKVVWEALRQWTSWWFQNRNSWPHMVEEIKTAIKAIKTRHYTDEQDRKDYLKYYLKNIFAWLIEAHQSRMPTAHDMFKWVWALKFFNEKRWITTEKVIFDANEIDNSKVWSKCDLLFDKFVYNILNDKWWLNVNDDIFSIIDNKKEKQKFSSWISDGYDMQ